MEKIRRKTFFCKCPYCGKGCGYNMDNCKHYRGIKYASNSKDVVHLFSRE
jgi:hypothetical protein